MERDFLVNVDNETKRSKVSKILTFLPTDRSLKKILLRIIKLLYYLQDLEIQFPYTICQVDDISTERFINEHMF